jgi:replicative superfamily II helicase
MVDFGELMGDEETAAPIEPTELFRSLVTADRLGYLRDVQQDVLRAWYARRSERDTIVKMSTGAGKTIAGLLMLQSSLNEGVSPALYLCPTIQLVDQVVSDAKDLGVSAVSVTGAGSLPVEFDNGEAILITTFQKLFNGRSIFGVTGSGRPPVQVGAVLVDDAHSCLRIARETATITLSTNSPIYSQLLSLFETALRAQSESQTAEIKEGHPWARLLVPYWAWQARSADVAAILARNQNTDELKFSWNLLKEELRACHCFFTGQKVEISPHLVPIRALPSFSNASRRFFLSATLADDSILPREFDVERRAVEQTVRPSIRGDAGERMILVPELIDPILGAKLPELLADKRDSYNVVVLVPSAIAASRWQAVGACVAQGNDVSPAIDRLRTATGQFVVLVNRYDGIDLPDDACRILVVDGLPIGDTLFDRYTADVRQNSLLAASRVAQTVEQGFGRGVRSGKDRCVVLLSGRELVRFISMKRHLTLFSPETREQIEIGRQISKLASEEASPASDRLLRLMNQCLKGDEKWRKFHATRMSKVVDDPLDTLRLTLGVNERLALNGFHAGDHQEAVRNIREIVNALGTGGQADAGWYLQTGAMLMQTADPAEAQQMQKRAHEYNSALLKPMAGVRYRRVALKAGIQAERVLAWAKEHAEPNAIIVTIADILSRLAFGVEADQFEQAWSELGEALGFEAQRPEKDFGKGPDELWALPGNVYLLAEARNDVKVGRTEIHQSETEQLSNSVNWFRAEYGDEPTLIPILLHPIGILARTAYPPDGSLVIDRESMNKLHDAMTRFAAALAGRAVDSWSAAQIGQLLEDHGLAAAAFKAMFCKPLRKSS